MNSTELPPGATGDTLRKCAGMRCPTNGAACRHCSHTLDVARPSLHLNLAVAYNEFTDELILGEAARTPSEWERTRQLFEQFNTVICEPHEAGHLEANFLCLRPHTALPVRTLVISRPSGKDIHLAATHGILDCEEGCLVDSLTRESVTSAVIECEMGLARASLKAGLIDSATIFCRGPMANEAVNALHRRLPQLPASFRQQPLGKDGVVLTYDFVGERRANWPKGIISTPLRTKYGPSILHGYTDSSSGHEQFAIQFGQSGPHPATVRIHSGCMTGDCLGSLHCDCGYELEASLEIIKQAGHGLLLYRPQDEGRGIGGLQKILAYNLQNQGLDTYQSNAKLGFAADHRNYRSAAWFLRSLGIRQVRLITMNPEKRRGLEELGIHVVQMISLPGGITPHNTSYLNAKVEHGHDPALLYPVTTSAATESNKTKP